MSVSFGEITSLVEPGRSHCAHSSMAGRRTCSYRTHLQLYVCCSRRIKTVSLLVCLWQQRIAIFAEVRSHLRSSRAQEPHRGMTCFALLRFPCSGDIDHERTGRDLPLRHRALKLFDVGARKERLGCMSAFIVRMRLRG